MTEEEQAEFAALKQRLDPISRKAFQLTLGYTRDRTALMIEKWIALQAEPDHERLQLFREFIAATVPDIEQQQRTEWWQQQAIA